MPPKRFNPALTGTPSFQILSLEDWGASIMKPTLIKSRASSFRKSNVVSLQEFQSMSKKSSSEALRYFWPATPNSCSSLTAALIGAVSSVILYSIWRGLFAPSTFLIKQSICLPVLSITYPFSNFICALNTQGGKHQQAYQNLIFYFHITDHGITQTQSLVLQWHSWMGSICTLNELCWTNDGNLTLFF